MEFFILHYSLVVSLAEDKSGKLEIKLRILREFWRISQEFKVEVVRNLIQENILDLFTNGRRLDQRYNSFVMDVHSTSEFEGYALGSGTPKEKILDRENLTKLTEEMVTQLMQIFTKEYAETKEFRITFLAREFNNNV
jgi:hypothetical protein